MSLVEISRIFFGSVFVLFIPGLAWSYVFFARKRIDWIERIALSFGLSIALVPLSVFWLNWLFHVPITLLSTCFVILGLTAIPIGYLRVRKSSWGMRLRAKLKSIIVFKFRKVLNLKTSLSKLQQIKRIFLR